MKKKILISTGGSGGHVIPGIILYEHLKNNFEVFLTSDKRGAKFIDNEIVKYTLIETPRLTKNIIKLPLDLIFLILSFLKAFNFIRKNNIDILISTGGYMSLPLCLSAKILKKKIFLFEPNNVLGRSNKLFLKFSKKIICYSKSIINFPELYKSKLFLINPLIRKEFYNEKRNVDSKINETFKILIIGGSQGAEFFDNEISDLVIDLFKENKVSIIQQITNESKRKFLSDKYSKFGLKNELFNFDKNLFQKYQKVDFAITRSGASTISELIFFNIPFLAIPLPTAKDNHQYYNAKNYLDQKLCWLVNQTEYKKEDIKELILELIKNPKNYLDKKSNMLKFSKESRWDNINKKLLELINEN